MLRMRVEAAASARCARSAPPVMLPASTTWRKRLRSVRSNRMGPCLGRLLPSDLTKENYAKYLLCARSLRHIFAVDEAISAATVCASDCDALRLWLRNVRAGRSFRSPAQRGTEKNNGRNQGTR